MHPHDLAPKRAPVLARVEVLDVFIRPPRESRRSGNPFGNPPCSQAWLELWVQWPMVYFNA